MKESAPAALPLPVESPEERKRRLARERQRRHREKLRANKQRASESNIAAASSTPPSNPDHIHHHAYRSNSITRPSPRSSSAHNHRSVQPPHSSTQHAPASLHSSPPQPSVSAPLPRHNSSLVHPSPADPPKPLVDATNAAAARLDASVPPSNHPSPPSVYGAKHAHSLSSHDHRTASHIHQQKLQLQYNQTQPLHQSLQPPHQSHPQPSHIASSAPRPAGNHLLHQPPHPHLTQQQPNHQVRRMHQVHHPHPQSSHHTSKSTPVAPTSLTQPTQQSTLKHPHHSQLQRPYGTSVHLHPQPFAHVSHAFPAPSMPSHVSQPHTNPADNPFNFQTTTNDPTLQQHAYVADAQRSYLNDLPPRDQHQYGRYPSPRIRQATQHTDASTAINAITQTIPPAVNGAHPSLPNSSTASNLPPTPVRIPSSLNRNTAANRFSQTQPSSQTLTPPLQSQITSAARDSNQDNSQIRNPNETAEERKRRLARERQRRRRKRLKLDPQVNPNKTHVDTSSRGEESHREAGATSQNAPIDINIHVRPAADNSIQMPSSTIQPALHTSFEAPSLAASSHPASLQPLQVAPVSATPEDIPAAGRNAYNTHSLTVGSGPNVSNGLSSSHRAAADLARMSGASDERIMRTNEPEEDPEARKRRLARDRQRRRRQRLKEKKIVDADKSQGQPSQTLKYEPTQSRIVDSVEATRAHSDFDRRTIPTDAITESVRMPLTTPPANVFAPRNDVTANMPFDQQNRLVRNAGASGVPESTMPPMTLSFNGNNGINLGAMPVSNVIGSQNLVHWSQGFESESAARFAVDAAVGAFRAHLGAHNPAAKAYVLQQGIIMLSAEEGGRELINGQILASLRTDGVMRIG